MAAEPFWATFHVRGTPAVPWASLRTVDGKPARLLSIGRGWCSVVLEGLPAVVRPERIDWASARLLSSCAGVEVVPPVRSVSAPLPRCLVDEAGEDVVWRWVARAVSVSARVEGVPRPTVGETAPA